MPREFDEESSDIQEPGAVGQKPAEPREPNTGAFREPNTGVEREPNTGITKDPADD
jgi:hypothetical protein